MSNLDRAAVEQLTLAAGLGPVQHLVPLTGGANNRVLRVETAAGPAIAKAYFRHPSDPRDRLGAEWAFARFAWAAGVRCVAQPLAVAPAAGLGLFAWLDGQAIAEATPARVEQAGAFIRALNAARWRPLASRLPIASEACFSLAEHLATVGRRVEHLSTRAEPPAQDFARTELLPVWHQVRDFVRDSGWALDGILPVTARCVSPSDFGFHNARERRDGTVDFLDFEYAGWDDPAKLICDFFCQPRVPVPRHWFDGFAEAIAASFPDPAAVVARARLLLPVYQVKWVCIRLNEFLPGGAQRRAFARPGEPLGSRQARQLAEARAAVHQLTRITI